MKIISTLPLWKTIKIYSSLQRFFLFGFIFLISVAANAGAKTWTGSVSTDWNTAGNWSPSGVPAAGDDVTIPNVARKPLLTTGSFFCHSLNISSGASVTQTGGILKVSGANWSVSGTLNVSGGNLICDNTITINSGGVVNLSGTGTIDMANKADVNASDKIVIAAGGVFNQSGGEFSVKDFTVNSGSPVGKYNQSGGTIYIYHDFKNSGSFICTGGTVDFVSNAAGGSFPTGGTNKFYNVIVDAGVDPHFDNNNVLIYIAGNFINNNNGLNLSNKANFVFNGTVDQTITTAVTNNNPTFGDLTIDKNSGTVILASDIIIADSLTVTDGTLNLGTYEANRKSAGGVFSVASGSILQLGGSTGGQTGSNFPLNFNTVTLTNGSTVEYNAADGTQQTIYAAPAYSNLTLSNSTGSGTATKITSANITVNSNLTVNDFTLLSPGAAYTIGGLGTLKGTGTVQVTRTTATADFVNQYTISHTTLTNLTVDYNATSAQTISALNYGNLLISGTRGSNNITLASSGTIGIAGDLTANASFTTGGYVATGSTVNINGNSNQTISATALLTFNNLTITNNKVPFAVNSNIVVNGNLTVNNNAILNPDPTVVISGSGTLTGSGTVYVNRIASPADFNTQYSIANKTLTNMEVVYLAAANQIVSGLTYKDLTLAGSGTKTASGNVVVNGTLTVPAGITFDLNAYTLSGTSNNLTNNGTIATQNTSATPLPVGKTWTGLINYNGSGAQTIVSGNYTNLTASGGNRTLSSTGTITITGTFTAGTGTYTSTGSIVNFNGPSGQTIPGISYYDLTISGNNTTKNLVGAVSIKDALTLSSKTTLALGNNNVTLLSDSVVTARVAQIPNDASITYGTGRFVVQRYVQGRRKYRLLTSPVNSSAKSKLSVGEESLSIWGNWQNSGNNTTPGIGTYITGGTAADGYDTQTSNASLYTYDDSLMKYIAYSSAKGKNTKYTPLKAGVGYYMFVYGDRTNSYISSTPNNTVLSSTGTLAVGDQTYTSTTPISLSDTIGRYALIGNPFASPIDWSKVQKHSVDNICWGWDPNLNSTGGYVTVNAMTDGSVLVAPVSGKVKLNQYIQSGQAFFVRTTGKNPSVTIREQDKVGNINNLAFRTSSTQGTANSLSLLAINLLYNSGSTEVLADGVVAAYSDAFSNGVNDEDALKIAGSAEVVSIENAGKQLSIDARNKDSYTDTLFLNIAKLTKSQYTFEIFAQQMVGSNVQAYLVDQYQHTSQPLSLTDTNHISINVNFADPASYDSHRFYVSTVNLITLPVNYTSVSAAQQGKNVQVQWSVAADNSTAKYQVERSNDGANFSVVGEVNAKGANANASYNFVDAAPVAGNNYYRIRSVSTNGSDILSKTVAVKINAGLAQINVFPNPVKDQQINLQLNDVEKGTYKVSLYNAQGIEVWNTTIDHADGSSFRTLQPSGKLAAGVYHLQVYNEKIKTDIRIFVE